MTKYTFRRLGEHPILDFCNTLILHEKSIEDDLTDPERDESFVHEFFGIKEHFDSGKHKELIILRTLLRDYFYYLIGLHDTDVRVELNKWLAEHSLILQISQDSEITFTSPKFKNHFAPFIESLNSFLQNLDLSRLKKCANPNCSHLFYDVSKNNRRQWCSMNSCGNIMKARAFYARKKSNSI